MDIKEYGVEEVKDPLEPELRERLETQFGEIVTIDIRNKVFAFRFPSRAEVRRYRQTIGKKDVAADDELEKLMSACVIHPSREEFTTHMEKYAMALGSAGIAFMSGTGFDFNKASIVK